MSVDLPEPLCPRMPMRSLAPTRNDTPSNALTEKAPCSPSNTLVIQIASTQRAGSTGNRLTGSPVEDCEWSAAGGTSEPPDDTG